MTVAQPPVPTQKPSTQAVTALVISVLGLCTCCGLILSPIGWYLGGQELKAIAAGQSPAAGETIAKVAQIVGIVGTLCLALALLWIFAMGGLVVVNTWIDHAMH
jgi:hypothetical protein